MKNTQKKRDLSIINARENNLKNLNVTLSHDAITTVTGLSGSGKSSFAFDTVYAEGQRRYIETFSPYTRQFFDKVKKPAVDSITHVRPAIAIQQRTRITSSRSTVGSLTNINDYLKILWANLSKPSCPHCREELIAWTPELVAGEVKKILTSVDSIILGAPLSISKKAFPFEKERFLTLGFSRFFNPEKNEVISIEEYTGKEPLPYLVIERMKGELKNPSRVYAAVDQAYTLGNGVCSVISFTDSRQAITNFHRDYYCTTHDWSIVPPKQSFFTYNHPLGACAKCNGFGHILEITEKMVVPNPQKSIREKAIQAWSTESTTWEYERLLKFCSAQKISVDTPWHRLSRDSKDKIFTHKSKEYAGVMPWFQWLERKKYKMHVRVFLSKYREQKLCPDCHGNRIKPAGLSFLIEGRSIADIWKMPISDLYDFILTTEKKVRSNTRLFKTLKDVFANLNARLSYLVSLGLPYLTLERQARTLSGGETQRVNLASALGSELVSTHFVLDEPSVGLHPRDSDRLIKAVKDLTDKGNSLLVVEHDPDFILSGDEVLELGPKAGAEGGEVVFHGNTSSWKGIQVPQPLPANSVPSKEKISIAGATIRNLKDVSVTIPLNRFVVLTGVSGSGKSTLVNEVLYKAFNKTNDEGIFKKITGFEHIRELLFIDQSPLARSPRANIATYSKIWDEVRNLLASTEKAKAKKLTKSSFSFNVDAGRCKACEGAGFIREDMQFLSDVYVPCEVCLGDRFQPHVLQVTYNGKNVAELLQTSVDEAPTFFPGSSSIIETVRTLSTLGLGHLRLGHSLSELSGGEAQRLKLVPYLQQRSKDKILFIFDEPTTGLHVHDIERLLTLFRTLTEQGHSVLCIEHNLTVIASADWIIDMGPEGGAEGGKVIAEGPKDKIIQSKSHTGNYLKEYLSKLTQKPSSAKIHRFERVVPDSLIIRGATEHNLKNVDVSVPLYKTVAITGVSGSGKSTLTKDIIYAEGQRRYLDCLSPYARQYIKELKKPEIQEIKNVPPTICVYQHTFQPSRLSTVGTLSESYSFLRLLFSKVGTQSCPDHPEYEIAAQTPEDIVKNLKSLKGQIRILAPVILHKKGTHKAVLEDAIKEEIVEVRVDGIFGRPGQFIGELEKSKHHVIEYVVAKCTPKNLDNDMLLDAVLKALSLGNNALTVITDEKEFIISTERACPVCHRGFFKPDPEDFSFHSKRGACKKCEGTGIGKNGENCSECGGTRLGPIGRSVKIGNHPISTLSSYTPASLMEFLRETFTDASLISKPILDELYSKLQALRDLGLEYLPLSRDCTSLSGGELQRLRLAAAFGSPLSGVMYILDEPSAGLHPIDNQKVLDRIVELKNGGNSVLVIEHDVESIKSCEHIIDVGPGAGTHGGDILFNGKRQDFLGKVDSPTAHALKDDYVYTVEASHGAPLGKVEIVHASTNNLKDVSATFPLGKLSVVCGVSGSGKSSLVHGSLLQTIEEGKKKDLVWTKDKTVVKSDLDIEKILYIDQKPIGANARSTPASYLNIWDHIRKVFAQTLEAKSHGWANGFFSYNSGKGRCPSCKGLGVIRLEMNFLAEADVQCEECMGTRYTDQAKTVKYLGYSINEVLNLTFEEAKAVFANHRQIHETLRFACEIGLGYLRLGQPSSTLSGGESQRIKLVAQLSKPPKKHSLYILDEPTIGLHRSDVAKLINSLHALCALGSTVIVIEHDKDMIESGDYIIEMGPGAGEMGGKIISSGELSKIKGKNTPWGRLLSEKTFHGGNRLLQECENEMSLG